MSPEEIKKIGTNFFEAQDKLKGKLPAELCTSDYKAYIAGFPPVDREGHIQMGIMFWTAFPDLHQIIDDVITDGKKVVMRFIMAGKNTGDFMGTPPTNKSIKVSGIAILNIANGKVKELHEEFNEMDLMKQLGLIPEEEHN